MGTAETTDKTTDERADEGITDVGELTRAVYPYVVMYQLLWRSSQSNISLLQKVQKMERRKKSFEEEA